MPSQTKKKGQKKSPKQLEGLKWLGSRKEMLARAHSFNESTLTDEEFFRFFEEIGEVARPSKNRSSNKPKTKKKRR